MKILILCTGRSGSTSLFNLIASHLKYKNCFLEPFTNSEETIKKWGLRDTISPYVGMNDILIKTFITTFKPDSDFDDYESYWNWMCEYFDKIILLSRKNKQLQAESLVYHQKIRHKLSEYYNWHKKKYYDLDSNDNIHILNTIDALEKADMAMIPFIEKNYPHFTFEDLFIKKDKELMCKLFDYIDIELDMKLYDKFVISDNNIVRLKDKPTNII
jgi:hypothetical protein